MLTNKKTYQIISFFLAILIFITSAGFTLDMHFCKGELKTISLIGKAKSCHDQAKVQCPHHQKNGASTLKKEKENNCCNNEKQYFQVEQDQIIPVFDFEKSADFLNLAPEIIQSPFDDYTFTNLIVYNTYKPPPIQKDIPVLFESFLL